MGAPQRNEFGTGLGNYGSLLLLNKNILPSHLHATARMNLQSNHTIDEFRRLVREVHDLHAIELRNNVIALHGHFQVVPLARFKCLLAFRGGHLHPATSSAIIESDSMLACAAVHL